MTHNQIDFQTLRENQRHNLEMESQGRNVLSETARHNQALELETNRANLTNEGIKRATLAETNRTNIANETIKTRTLAETSRANRAQESLKHESNILNYKVGMSNVLESVRHNRNVEGETQRHNIESENLTSSKNLMDYEVGKTNAAANTKSAEARALDAAINKDLASSVKARNWGAAINSVSGAINSGVKTLSDVASLFPRATRKVKRRKTK